MPEIVNVVSSEAVEAVKLVEAEVPLGEAEGE